MMKDPFNDLIDQLRKEHISDDVLHILHDDFLMRRKQQEFVTNIITKYPEDTLLLQETFAWVQEQHSKQQQIITIVPNTITFPYFSHPLSVALSAMSLCLPSSLVQACLLHDVIEDCACKEQQFIAKRGKRTASKIMMLSKQPGESHQDYLTRIMESPLCIKQIKALDIYHNLIRALTVDYVPYLQRLLKEVEVYYLPLFAHDKKLSLLYPQVKKLFQAVCLHCVYLSNRT